MQIKRQKIATWVFSLLYPAANETLKNTVKANMARLNAQNCRLFVLFSIVISLLFILKNTYRASAEDMCAWIVQRRYVQK
jgi:predicted nucleic-acid-binding protein